MLKTIAAALVATSLIASPVLAQGNSTQPATTTQMKGKVAVKHHKAHRHVVKIHKHRKHVKHVRHTHAPKASLHGHKHVAKQGKYLRIN